MNPIYRSYDMHHLSWGASLLMANRRKDKLLKRVTISVDPDDYARLENIAGQSDVSASWLVRRSIREFLIRHASETASDLSWFSGLHPVRPEGGKWRMPSRPSSAAE
jgi:hypothetical protein